VSTPLESFNLVVSNLNETSNQLGVLRIYWTSFTPAQKTALKNLTIGVINQAITDLTAVKTEIGNL
jgi:hypothetical protein